jgi:hypothetical protein
VITFASGPFGSVTASTPFLNVAIGDRRVVL